VERETELEPAPLCPERTVRCPLRAYATWDRKPTTRRSKTARVSPGRLCCRMERPTGSDRESFSSYTSARALAAAVPLTRRWRRVHQRQAYRERTLQRPRICPKYRKMKQDDVRGRMVKAVESTKVSMVALGRSGCPVAPLGSRRKSYKTNGVVPPAGLEPALRDLTISCSWPTDSRPIGIVCRPQACGVAKLHPHL
jgi:hypothetical protein